MSSEFQFKPEVAELYGVNEAIYLHSLSFWLTKNRSNKKHLHNGRYWSYDTHKAIAERFPFWTVRQIERIVSSCEAQGAILVDNFNADKTDRTKWYTLAGGAEEIYLPETVVSNPPNGEMAVPQEVDGDSPNGEMGEKDPVPFTQTVKCIKETVTRTGTNTPLPPKGDERAKRKRAVAEWKPERFEDFWQYYSKRACGRDKQGARDEWNKLKPDDALIDTMVRALKVQLASAEWQRGIGIPYACRWIKKRRWEDEVAAAAPSDGTGATPISPRQSHVVVQDGEEVVVFV